MKLRIRNKLTGRKFTKKVSSKDYPSAVEEVKRKIIKNKKDPDLYEVLGEVLE